ncbi:endolytic transglycosylase MltG [Chitinivibrio alkaliphilus]|nr:endolytic transglycosylase MltG [Chitinivibrio alkaliphilus]
MQIVVKKFVMFILVIVTLLCGLLAYWGFYAPEERRGETVRIEIPRGASLRSIAELLEDAEIIPHWALFYYYVRYQEVGHKIQAGAYAVPEQSGVLHALEVLLGSALVEGVTVTIPEGLTIEQTARTIARQYPIDTVRFDSLARDSSFMGSLSKDSYESLEGFLFPETYLFPKELSEEQIIRILVRQYTQAMEAILEEVDTPSLSPYEAVILASIIEKETNVAHELRRVSGVFHNRLDQNIPLGADATVRFIINRFTGPLRVSELQNPSPYNTRIHRGLPPGPICSPGKAAIVAALDPLETDELFLWRNGMVLGNTIFLEQMRNIIGKSCRYENKTLLFKIGSFQ